MKEEKIKKDLLKKNTITILIIEIISVLVLFISKSRIMYYLIVIVTNFLLYYIISSITTKKLFDSNSQNKNTGIIQRFNFRIWLSYVSFPIIFLLISFFSKTKFWAISISIILFSSIAYLFKKNLLKIENKVAKFNYKKQMIYISNNKFFSDSFLLTIPVLLDIYNMVFSFNKKYFLIIISIYFIILTAIMLYAIINESKEGDPNKKER